MVEKASQAQTGPRKSLRRAAGHGPGHPKGLHHLPHLAWPLCPGQAALSRSAGRSRPAFLSCPPEVLLLIRVVL